MYSYFPQKIKRKIFKNGFTLVEIMVVVAIIAILLSIGIPGLIRSRTIAYEGTAAANLRAVNNACQLYLSTREVYPNVLSELVAPASNPPYLDPELATSRKQNYDFIYVVTEDGFTVNANPVNRMGNPRYFFMNQTGIIHGNENGQAGVNDPIFA